MHIAIPINFAYIGGVEGYYGANPRKWSSVVNNTWPTYTQAFLAGQHPGINRLSGPVIQ